MDATDHMQTRDEALAHLEHRPIGLGTKAEDCCERFSVRSIWIKPQCVGLITG